MAYTDFAFYRDTYYGDVLTEDNAPKWLDRASDAIDTITFGRLAGAFPQDVSHATKVKKAVCAIAEALFCINEQGRAVSMQKADDGTYRGAVTSISSGNESISFSSGNSANASVYAAAAASDDAKLSLLRSIAAIYLANIPDANGINLLYAGGG